MGAKITAMDFEEDSSIIFFGTVKGDIGFIRFSRDNKSQPVYDPENALGSQITSIRYFKHTIGQNNAKPFLLATGLKSKAVVFEVDSNFLKPNNKFSGNTLPDQDLGNISQAVYDPKQQKIILETQIAENKSAYIWNPFTAEILDELKIVMKAEKPGDVNYKKLLEIMNGPDVKFY